MRQRFYYTRHSDNYYEVFMGNEAMQTIRGGLFVSAAGTEERAQQMVKEYTDLFNLMRDAEDATITESL